MPAERSDLNIACSRSAWEQLAAFFGARSVPGVEDASGDTYVRSLSIGDDAGVVELSHTEEVLHCRVRSGDLEARAVEEKCRRAFDLATDSTEMTAALRADPALRSIVDAHPGIRVPGAFDGNEIAVRAILGQQISVKGAATLAGRLVVAHGTPLEHPVGGVTCLFPAAGAIAAAELKSVGMPEARRRTLRAVTSSLASGEIILEHGCDPVTTARRLIDIPGIGEWTASYICMRALGDADAFLAGDLGVRKGAAALGLPSSPRSLTEYAERWRPWRSYAVMYLWEASRVAP